MGPFYFNSISKGSHIGGVMVSLPPLNAVDCGFEPWSGLTKEYKICCFSAKHAALRRKNKDGVARNRDNVSEWGNMSIRWLLFQWASTIKIQLSMLVKYKADLIIISMKNNLFSPWYNWNIADLALNNNHSLPKVPMWRPFSAAYLRYSSRDMLPQYFLSGVGSPLCTNSISLCYI